jgi:hypothetical protein
MSQQKLVEKMRDVVARVNASQAVIEPASTRHRCFEVGERVVVAYDGGSFYEGVKGCVSKVRSKDVTVDFDKPIRNVRSGTFDTTSTKLMHL